MVVMLWTRLRDWRSSVGRPDAVKELHDGVVDHEWDADVHTNPTKSRDSAFVEPVSVANINRSARFSTHTRRQIIGSVIKTSLQIWLY